VSQFLVVTVLLFGAAASLSGQALARNWRPAWQIVVYTALLAAADRFLLYALFGADLASLVAYAAAWVILLAAASLGYRVTRARRMVAQYPWLYERAGPFGWRERRSPMLDLPEARAE